MYECWYKDPETPSIYGNYWSGRDRQFSVNPLISFSFTEISMNGHTPTNTYIYRQKHTHRFTLHFIGGKSI